LKPKDLVGIPWRVAFALQADGWYLRSDIIWSKPNPMPESVTDRPTKAHEYLFLLTKAPRYFYDADAIREPHQDKNGSVERFGNIGKDGGHQGGRLAGGDGIGREPFALKAGGREYNPAGRNRRSVWEIATEPYPDAHFATFPQALVEPCVLAGTSERGCCPECGAPWTREVAVPQEGKPDPNAVKAHGGLGNNLGGGRHQTWRNENPAQTLGWSPSCDHGHEPIPATVLDCFSGSGTTALVARKHGRRSIGIELNPEYADLAAKRLSQLSLLSELA
jgi:DNA modification methylase